MHYDQLHKPKRKRSIRKLPLIITGAVLLCAAIAGCIIVKNITPDIEIEDADTYGELTVHTADQVQRLSVKPAKGDSWTIVRGDDGSYTLEDDPDFAVSDNTAQKLAQAACVISYDDILTEDPAEYRDRPDEFGLGDDCIDVKVEYTDGTGAHIRIGSSSPLEDETWYYMLIDGDDRLFTLDKGTVDTLNVERALLHTVVQPTLHKARFDSVTFEGPNGIALQIELQGSITDDEANAHWLITAPWRYHADTEAMDNLRSNLANVRLGAYVCEGTAERLTEYGFDSPAFRLTIHMAEGEINDTAEDGTVTPVNYPEETFVLTVGNAKNDNVDYVLYDGSIYITSHYSLDVFESYDPLTLVSRYPIMLSLDELASLKVTQNGETHTYEVSRWAKTDEDGSTVTDDDGNTVYDGLCLMDGETEIPYSSFEAAYARLEVVTVSGQLPDGWEQTEEPHTVYTLTGKNGNEHTIALTKFDALHDAVIVDNCALFYLIQDGMVFQLETDAG